jgi:hypothetical protein
LLQIQQGVWFDDPKRPYKRAHKTQIQELLGYFLGKWGTRAIYVMMFTMVGHLPEGLGDMIIGGMMPLLRSMDAQICALPTNCQQLPVHLHCMTPTGATLCTSNAACCGCDCQQVHPSRPHFDTQGMNFLFAAVLQWFGLGVAQILASSTNYYSINPTYSLR